MILYLLIRDDLLKFLKKNFQPRWEGSGGIFPPVRKLFKTRFGWSELRATAVGGIMDIINTLSQDDLLKS
jgi:hypothetical protein